MKIFKRGDKVIIQGKKYPGIVINTEGTKVTIRTDDNRSLIDVNSEKVDLLKLAEKLFT